MQYSGKAHVVGANIDTDAIIPARFLVTTDEAELGRNCTAGLEDNWSSRAIPGDHIVAGVHLPRRPSPEHCAVPV